MFYDCGKPCCWLILCSVFFIFPPAIPLASAEEMNFVIVVVAIVLVMMVCAWFAEGRRTFTGVSNSIAMRNILMLANSRRI